MPDPATGVAVSKNDVLELLKHMLILKHATRSPETRTCLPLTVGRVAVGIIASVTARVKVIGVAVVSPLQPLKVAVAS